MGLTKNELLVSIQRMQSVHAMISRWNPHGKLDIKGHVLREFYESCSKEHLPMSELTYINGLIEGVRIALGDDCWGHIWRGGRWDNICIRCGREAKGGAWKDRRVEERACLAPSESRSATIAGSNAHRKDMTDA